ncbi:MAG: Flp/Fap pilin component [Pseudomonadota bacterium]|jgi:Flp pilus assembly pilin Flp
MRTWRDLIRDREGATAVEYGVMLVMVALVAAVGFGRVGNSLSNTLHGASNQMTNARAG